MTTPLMARRNRLGPITSLRPEMDGAIHKEIKMHLMVEDLARDRMRRVQREAELRRAANRLRKQQALDRIRTKIA